MVATSGGWTSQHVLSLNACTYIVHAFTPELEPLQGSSSGDNALGISMGVRPLSWKRVGGRRQEPERTLWCFESNEEGYLTLLRFQVEDTTCMSACLHDDMVRIFLENF